MKNARKPYNEFEIELIKRIPSNTFIGWITGRNPLSISTKRKTLGASPSRSFGLKKAKKEFKTLYAEIAAKFGETVNKGTKQPKAPKIVKVVQNTTSMTVMINDKLVTISHGDKIVTEADGIYVKKKIS